MSWLFRGFIFTVFLCKKRTTHAIFRHPCCKVPCILFYINGFSRLSIVWCLPILYSVQWRERRRISVLLYLAVSVGIKDSGWKTLPEFAMPFYFHIKEPRKNALANMLQWITSIWSWSVSPESPYTTVTGGRKKTKK